MEQDSNPCGLCKMGCGFYGNQSYDGMCSKCFKDQLKKQQQTTQNVPGRTSPATGGACGSASAGQLIPNPSALGATTTTATESSSPIEIPQPGDIMKTPSKEMPSSLTEEPSSPSSQLGSLDDSQTESPGKTKKRNRCYTCRKKVGLTGFECRCGGVFCGLHRYSDKHNCTYDYKADGREQIAKANPVIVGEKIKKI